MRFLLFFPLVYLWLIPTSVFCDHYDHRDLGDMIIMQQEYNGIPEGTRMPLYEQAHTASGGGLVRVYYNGNKKTLYSWHENQNWRFELPVFDTDNILKGLGFLSGISLVIIYALAWNSRTL
jgi:hypothetical protein